MLPFLIGKQQLHIGAGNYQGKILGEIQEETPSTRQAIGNRQLGNWDDASRLAVHTATYPVVLICFRFIPTPLIQ